ncbi:MAG TPA: hypothetical protein VKO18_19465 [Terriglobia bacterium]|nr:hypothetical protein [Terriglobia bacterium]
MSILAGYTYSKSLDDNEREEGAYSDGGSLVGLECVNEICTKSRRLAVESECSRFTCGAAY